MIEILLAVTAATGVYLLYTSIVFGHRALSGSPSRTNGIGRRIDEWLTSAGITPRARVRLASGIALAFGFSAFLAWALFGSTPAALLAGIFGSSFPLASLAARRSRLQDEAREAWPRMIEEIRLLCGSLGRPIPQALLEVGKRGPAHLRPAFFEAERQWQMSTDFSRTLSTLKDQLADPTADAVCETLLVAHAVGGTDVDRRLAALAEDRAKDLQGRQDARAKQAGVRFARRFVLIVPLGMALAGISIGNGRSAYQTAGGQMGVLIGLVVLAACWWWAGRLIRLPEEERVFRA